jgi:hypothetical protein
MFGEHRSLEWKRVRDVHDELRFDDMALTVFGAYRVHPIQMWDSFERRRCAFRTRLVV